MYLLEKNRTEKYLDLAEFNRCMKANDTQLKDEFLEQMYRSFQGIKNDKGAKSANLDGEFCLKYPISNNNIKYLMGHVLNVTEFNS